MKIVRLIFFTLLMIVTFSLPAQAKVEVNSQCVVLMDMDTGQVLYEKKGYTLNQMDNMTKLLNVSTAIHNGDLNEKLSVTENALLETTKDPLAGKLGLKTGEEIPLKDALFAQILLNANDAARVVAGNLGNEDGDDKIGGSDDIKAYLKMMKYEARYSSASSMGIANVMGVTSSDQICTAMDLAKLMFYNMKNATFSQLLTTKSYDVKVYKTKSVTTTTESSNNNNDSDTKEKESNTTTTNVSVANEPMPLESSHKMVNGTYPINNIKGGFAVETESNGFHSVTYAKRPIKTKEGTTQRRLLVVIMKAPTENNMYEDIETLVDYGFKEWEPLNVSQKKLDNYLPSDLSSKKIVFEEDLSCLVPIGTSIKDLKTTATVNENQYCNGDISFYLKNNPHPVYKANFFEVNKISITNPWVKNIGYLILALLFLLCCYLFLNRAILPHLKQWKKIQRERKANQRPKQQRKKHYQTEEKIREYHKKNEEYFNSPYQKSKRKGNRERLHRRKKI